MFGVVHMKAPKNFLQITRVEYCSSTLPVPHQPAEAVNDPLEDEDAATCADDDGRLEEIINFSRTFSRSGVKYRFYAQ